MMYLIYGICQRDKLYMGIYYLYSRQYKVYSLAYNCHISLADSAVVKLVIKMFWELFMPFIDCSGERITGQVCVWRCVCECATVCVCQSDCLCVCVCVRRSNLFEVVQNVLRQFSQFSPVPEPGTGTGTEPVLMGIIMHNEEPKRCRTSKQKETERVRGGTIKNNQGRQQQMP